MNLFIDAVAPEHPLYGYMRTGKSERFRWVGSADEADAVVLALEDKNSQARIERYLQRGKITTAGRRFFLYFESTFWLTEYCEQSLIDSLREEPLLLGIVSHAQQTLDQVFQLLGVKCFHLPVGVPRKGLLACPRSAPPDPLTFLFWSSHNPEENTWLDRGGAVVDRLLNGYCSVSGLSCRLIARVPADAKLTFGDVERYEGRLPQDKLEELHGRANVFLLPSVKAHFISVPYAMSFGLPVVGLEHWAMRELVTDGVDGIIARDEADLLERCLRLPEQLDFLSLGALATQLRCHDVARYAERWEKILAEAGLT